MDRMLPALGVNAGCQAIQKNTRVRHAALLARCKENGSGVIDGRER